MVKIKHPDELTPQISLVLIYGPNEGLVRATRQALIARWGSKDPFQQTVLTSEQLASSPQSLVREAATLSLGGQERLLIVDEAQGPAAEACGAALQAYLDRPEPTGARVIVTCGALSPRSKVRRAVEQAPSAAALPCYGDAPKDSLALTRRHLGAHGITAQDDALAFLAQRLGADRGVALRELEKLVLYMGDDTQVTVPHVQACCEGSGGRLDMLMDAVGLGQLSRAERLFTALWGAGETAVGILAFAQAHFIHLHSTKRAFHFSREAALRHQRVLWDATLLEEALLRLRHADAACRRYPSQGFGLCHKVLTSLALQAAAQDADTPRPAAPRFGS